MKQRKIPLRTCIVSKEKLPKIELIRIVRNPEGQILVDESGKMSGRGCYLKKDLEVINKAQVKKIIDRELEVSVPDDIYEELKNIIK